MIAGVRERKMTHGENITNFQHPEEAGPITTKRKSLTRLGGIS